MKKLTIILLLVLTSMTVFAQRYRSGNTTTHPINNFSIASFNQNEKFYVIPPHQHRTDGIIFMMVAHFQILFTDNTTIMLQSVPNVSGEYKGLKFEPTDNHHEALKKKTVKECTIKIKQDGSIIKFKPTDSKYFTKQYN